MSPEQKSSRRKQTTVAWDNEKKKLWDELSSTYKLGPSVYARFCLEEILALQMPDEKLIAAGLERQADQRPGYYIPMALKKFAAVSSTAVKHGTSENPVHGPRIIPGRRRAR